MDSIRPLHRFNASSGAVLILAGILCFAISSCHNNGSSSTAISTAPATGTVKTTWGAAVAGALVYLIPAEKVPSTAITSADVLSGASEKYDEPLEDAVANAAKGDLPNATTASDGTFSVSGVDPSKNYFPFVAVDNATPAGLYPGGTLSRVVRSGLALLNMEIKVTGHPSTAATYVGSSTCLTCHPSYAAQKVHAHRLGFRRPGVTGALQDLSRKPGFDGGVASFKDATAADFKTKGTSLYFHNFDSTRGFDKFQVSQSDPGGAEIRVYIWKDTATGKFMLTMQNLVKTTDPDRTYVVDMTYGGAVHKQRYMLAVNDPGYKGHYPCLQYQHDGDDSYYDRTRKVWRDYHIDWFWDATNKLLRFPSKSSNIESNCLACHATGYRYFTDKVTGERLCDSVNDTSGVFDIDKDGSTDELNTGCEVCHGPGSEHVAVAKSQFIVFPGALSPSRESQMCGRCHDRVEGNDDLKNDQPLNAAGEMAPPGTSRADFLANYTSRKGPKLSSFWPDKLYSKSHQQYTDFIKSKHYRNNRRLVVCSDCHDSHGEGEFDGELQGNPATGELCAKCHIIDLVPHLIEYTGSSKVAGLTKCTSCHFYKIAKSGAGRRGALLGAPTGGLADAGITYWENDISSHLTVVPHKNNKGVSGVVPGKAMPIPYVNRCTTCHDARFLQYQK